MTDNDGGLPKLDFTAKGVEFSDWKTVVENDVLYLGRLSFEDPSPLVTLFQEGLTLSLRNPDSERTHALEATFISLTRRSEIRFRFNGVVAFRVLDENGLLELWEASVANPRPAQATFRARGHQWTAESMLVFLDVGDEPRFSYFVATDDRCLEVVCREEPDVREIGPAIVAKA